MEEQRKKAKEMKVIISYMHRIFIIADQLKPVFYSTNTSNLISSLCPFCFVQVEVALGKELYTWSNHS